MSVVLWITAAYVAAIMGCLFGQWAEAETRRGHKEAQERRVAQLLMRARRAPVLSHGERWSLLSEGAQLAAELAKGRPSLAVGLLSEIARLTPRHECSISCRPVAHALFVLAA